MAAMELGRSWWWLGLMVGAAVGYFSHDWRAVVRAIPDAYRAARGWVPPEGLWKVAWSDAMAAGTAMSWVCVWSFGCAVVLGAAGEGTPPDDMVRSIPLLFLFTPLAMAITWVIRATYLVRNPDRIFAEPTYDREMLTFRHSAPYVLCWTLPVWIVRAAPGLVLDGLAGMVAAVAHLRSFAWELFVRIHSEARTICMLGAAVGASVGYLAGSATVGALVGGALGFLSYRLITVRWLAPAGYVTLPVRR
jgi:hypothetical protein